MKNLFVVGIEATCHRRGEEPEGFSPEIIEFGISLVSFRSWEALPVGSIVVRPTFYPFLSGFCKELTGIAQSEVDFGAPIGVAMSAVRAKYESVRDPVFCSWGLYGRNMILGQCRGFNLPYPFGNPDEHINLKAEFGRFYGHGKLPLGEAIARVGLEFLGKHHRGGDDALNAGRIALRMAKDGWRHPLFCPEEPGSRTTRP